MLVRDDPNLTLIQHFLQKGVLTSVMENLLTQLCDIAASVTSAELELFEETKMGTKSYLILALRQSYMFGLSGSLLILALLGCFSRLLTRYPLLCMLAVTQ